MEAGHKYLIVNLLTEEISSAKAKDKPALATKLDQKTYGKGDKLSTPAKDIKKKDETPAQQDIPDALVTQLNLKLQQGGMDPKGKAMIFQNPRYALEKVLGILIGHCLRAKDPIPLASLESEAKTLTFPLAWTNPSDFDIDGPPVPTNRNLTINWAETAPNQFMATAEIK